MDEFICVKTGLSPDIWMIYKYDYPMEDNQYMYRRYDDEGVIMYKSYEAVKKKVDELNG